MRTTKTKTKSAFQKDLENAQQTFNAYVSMKKEKASIDASMKAAKSTLEAFGKKYKEAQFDDNGRLELDGGYLKFGKESEVIIDDKKFSWEKMIKNFPKLVKLDFNRSPMQKILVDGDKRKGLDAIGVDMKFKDKFDIKVQGEEEES